MIPEGTPVHRAWAVDSKRHLSVQGRYFDLFEVPDRWQSWILPGIVKGCRTVWRYDLDLVFSTYPIASAHLIGCAVSRLTGRPWVADLRDPMLQAGVPSSRLRRAAFGWIERLIFRHASRVVVTTQGCADFYVERYGRAVADRLAIIENGYDDELFPAGEAQRPQVHRAGPLKLIHSGVIYRDGRDPSNLFQALREMLDAGEVSSDELHIVFRAPGVEVPLADMITNFGLDAMVSIQPPIAYRDALVEMMEADGLLIVQGDSCNRQIPAKVYEYLFARTPIVGLATPEGDTGRLLSRLGLTAVAPLESATRIRQMLNDVVPALRDGSLPRPDDAAVVALSRRERAREFADMFNAVALPRRAE